MSVLSVGVVCECTARALGHRGCPEKLPAGRRTRLSSGLAHARLVSTSRNGAPRFHGIDRSRVCRCVRLPGSWGSDRRGVAARGSPRLRLPAAGREKCLVRAPEGLGPIWGNGGAPQRRAGFIPALSSAFGQHFPLSGFFLGRETASVMPSVEAKNFVDRVEDKTQNTKTGLI